MRTSSTETKSKDQPFENKKLKGTTIDNDKSVDIPGKGVEENKPMSEEDKYKRRTTEEQLQNARARYLARKLAKVQDQQL